MNTFPFGPNSSKTKILNATNASGTITFDATDVSSTPSPANAGPSGGRGVIRVYNLGPALVFVRWGASASVGAAAVTDMPVVPGVVELFTKGNADDTLAGITSTGTATVYVTCGEGM